MMAFAPKPLVSVILPTYNRAALLIEALASVRAQTFDDWECIVVDDGSTDATPGMLTSLADPRFRSITIAHSGNPAVPRNAALAVARGRLLAFLDDDDLWKPEKLAVQVPLLEDGAFRWSYTGFTALDAHGHEVWRSSVDRLPSGSILASVLETRAAIALPTVMAERALVTEAGGFDAAMRTREDYALWLSLAERAPVVTTPDLLTVVRDHPGRVFRPEGNRMSLVVYRTWLDRVGDPALRRICRRRLAVTYLTEVSRAVARREWWTALGAAFQATRSDPPFALRRLVGAFGRRILRLARGAGTQTPRGG